MTKATTNTEIHNKPCESPDITEVRDMFDNKRFTWSALFPTNDHSLIRHLQ